jgi:hypothetical protein
MSADDDRIERRPVVSQADVRVARAVAEVVRELRVKYPNTHICSHYDGPYITVHVVDEDGGTLHEEWIAR